MMDFKYENGDRVIENGDWATVDGSDAMAQRIDDNLSTFLGEWFLDLSYGPDYRQYILIKNPRLDVVNAVIKAAILRSQQGDFLEFSAILDSSRNLTTSYQLDTTGGIASGTVNL